MQHISYRLDRSCCSIVRLEKEQKVISSVPYRLVRHPMYSAILILVLFTPTALELSGYCGYCLRTRFRIVPLLF